MWQDTRLVHPLGFFVHGLVLEISSLETVSVRLLYHKYGLVSLWRATQPAVVPSMRSGGKQLVPTA